MIVVEKFGEDEEIVYAANRISVEEGILMLLREDEIVRVYSKGAWKTVRVLTDDAEIKQ